jgi:hypothetical protein
MQRPGKSHRRNLRCQRCPERNRILRFPNPMGRPWDCTSPPSPHLCLRKTGYCSFGTCTQKYIEIDLGSIQAGQSWWSHYRVDRSLVVSPWLLQCGSLTYYQRTLDVLYILLAGSLTFTILCCPCWTCWDCACVSPIRNIKKRAKKNREVVGPVRWSMKGDMEAASTRGGSTVRG